MKEATSNSFEGTISIIIPCRNEGETIEACLADIISQDFPKEKIEIIVADGLSNDGTRERVLSLACQVSRIRLIDNPGKFVSSGLNAAIKIAKGEIFIRMDAHTTYAKDYVSKCVEVLEETGADNVGGPWGPRNYGLVSSIVGETFKSPFSSGGALSHNYYYEGPVDSVYLGCWKRSTFDRFGYFDEELVRNQDDEFNLRIIRSGGKVFQSPKIQSWYKPRATFIALFMQYFQYGYWKVRVIQKHRFPASWRHLIPALFVLWLPLLGISLFSCKSFFYSFNKLIFFCYSGLSFFFSINLEEQNSIFPVFSYHLFYFPFELWAGFHSRNFGFFNF